MERQPRIFIGSSAESLRAAKGIKANLETENFEVRVWDEDIFEPGRYTLDELVRFTKSFDFAIFVWEGVDKIESRDQSFFSPRDNVILEAGMFYSVLGREKVFLFAPSNNAPKLPSNLLGLPVIYYKETTDKNFVAATSVGSLKVIDRIKSRFSNSIANDMLAEIIKPLNIYLNIEEAKKAIQEDCLKAVDIKILSNKGLDFFGSDSSIISLASAEDYQNLKQLKIILLSPNSRWINRGLMALRKYETVEDFKKELLATHQIVEFGMQSFLKNLNVANSGIKYQLGEPYFRLIMSDKKVFVSSYGESPTTQVKDLPVYEFNNGYGSMFGALRRHFNDLWKNNSEYGTYMKKAMELEISSGGILVHKYRNEYYVALLQRDDGSWVLPKGHKMKKDKTLEQAAIREVSEETGIHFSKLHVINTTDSYSYDETAESYGKNKIVHFFLMEYIDNDLPELATDPDHISAKWWNLKEEIPVMRYTYQKVLLYEKIKDQFSIEIHINSK